MLDLSFVYADNLHMQTNKSFSLSDALSFGWNTFKSRPFFWIVVTFLIGFGSSGGSGSNNDSNASYNPFEGMDPAVVMLIVAVLVILGLVLAYIFLALEMGAYKATFEAVDGKTPTWSILTTEFDLKRVFMYVVISIAYGALVLLGIILLLIPGIYWALKYQYASLFYIEKNTSISESFRLSAVATEGVKWRLLGYGIVLGLIAFVGVLFFLVGMFVTIPVSVLAAVYIYKNLASKALVTQDAVVQSAPVAPAQQMPTMPEAPMAEAQPLAS